MFLKTSVYYLKNIMLLINFIIIILLNIITNIIIIAVFT